MIDEKPNAVERVFGIVIPFYREKDYLIELVESLKKQTDPRFEVLIVDDSCSMMICPEFITEKLDDRFTIKTNEANLGPFLTWNLGLSEMMKRQRYCLISIVHEDDVLHCDYVRNSISYLARHPEIDVFHSKAKIIGPNGKRKFSFQDSYKCIGYRGFSSRPVLSVSDKGLAKILRKNFVFCPTMVFNTAKFSTIEFDSRKKMVSDLDFISKSLIEGRSFLQFPDKNYFYRRHRNNLTAKLTRSTERFEEEIQFYKELEIRCTDFGFQKSAVVAGKLRIIKLHLFYRILLAILKSDIVYVRRLVSILMTSGK